MKFSRARISINKQQEKTGHAKDLKELKIDCPSRA